MIMRMGIFGLIVVLLVYCSTTGLFFDRLDSWFRYHRIEIAGNELLSQKDVLDRLPLSRDNLWWYQNTRMMSYLLAKDPLVKEAIIEPCVPIWFNLKNISTAVNAWGCFRVDIVERTPSFRLALGHQQWLIDDEGVLLTVIPAAVVPALAMPQPVRGQAINNIDNGGVARQNTRVERLSKLPLLEGVIGGIASPDEVIARIRYLIDRHEYLQQSTGFTVSRIRFLDRAEMVVNFEELPFLVRFGTELHSVPGDFTKLDLAEQVTRLKSLLSRVIMDPKVVELDLGFNKLAVIRH